LLIIDETLYLANIKTQEYEDIKITPRQ